MDVKISKLGLDLFRKASPVSEIMNFTGPKRLQDYGINPAELISFGGGWVNHSSPALLQKVYSDIINDDLKFHHSGGYSPANGEDEFKEAVIKFESHLFGMTGLSPENIAAGQSSTALAMLLFNTLLDEGDTICLLDPSYCNYPMQIATGSKAKIIRFPVINENNFEYIANNPSTLSDFHDFLIKRQPKLVLLVSPDNPTSQVLSDDFIHSACDAVRTYGGAVVIDFAYKTLVFDRPPDYFSRPPDGNFITLHSNSKWCRGLGRRLGWIEAPKYIIDSLLASQYNTILSPDRLHQMAFSEYIDKSLSENSLSSYIEETRELYRETAEYTIRVIKENIKYPLLIPQGGLYTCIQVSVNSAKFVEDLLKSTGVLFIPGWGFGRTLSKSVRVSYGPLVNNHPLIKEGIEKTGDFIRNYKP